MTAGRYNRLSVDARRNLCFDNPFVWKIARDLNHLSGDLGGRPNEYPLWVSFLWLLLIHEYGSSRKVEEAFEDITHGPWAQIRRAAEQEFRGDRPDLIPPEGPPSRNQFNYALKHHLPRHTATIAALIKIRSAEVALAAGLGSPVSPGSANQPSLERVAFGDVTVMTARARRTRRDARQVNKTTGEIISHRHDPDAGRHTTGGGSVVTGLPWAFTHVRGPRRNQQVILAVDPVIPQSTTEGHLAVDQYLEAATRLTGLVGYAYDRALRGVHLDRLLKAGHIGLVGVHQSKGEPADRYHGIEVHHHADGTQTEVEIHLVGGAPHLRVYDVDGNPQLHPLQRRRINKRYNKKTNDYRLSAEYEVVIDPARDITDGYIRIRLDQTAADRMRGYNRTEHVRAFPETDSVFTRIQRPLRASAESANRTIDDHLPRERLHHFGFERNQLSMLAWQAYRNSQTEAIFTPQGRITDQPAWPLAA